MNNDGKRLPNVNEPLSPEKRADDIMRSVLGLNQAELADVYRSQTADDPTEKLYELAAGAAANYQKRGEPIPSHVEGMLNSARQQHLTLEGLSLRSSIPKILLVDADAERMISRRAVFEAHQYCVEIAFTLAEALEKLGSEDLQAVIVEWSPASPEDLEAIQALQTWNLQIPIINVSAWARLARHDDRRFSWNLVRALARAFGRPVPRKLPVRKPVAADSRKAEAKRMVFE